MQETWFTLDDIVESDNADKLYCIAVDSDDKQFLAGAIGVPTHNTDQGKEEDALRGEAQSIIGSIARLGRAAGIHLAIATQRPDASLLPGELKANLGVRINCGRTGSTASSMILDSGDGARVKSNPRGRLFLKIYGSGDHGQGFFAQPSWIDEYLASKGLNPDGTPITQRKSRLANIADMSEFEGTDLDARSGIDHASIIEKIREEESEIDFNDVSSGLDSFDDSDDWDFDEIDDDEGEAPAPKQNNSSWGSLELGKGGDDSDKWHRPEDDWSSDLEDLIAQNFDEN